MALHYARVMLLADIAPSTDDLLARALPFLVGGGVALALGAWLLRRPGKRSPSPEAAEKPANPGP